MIAAMINDSIVHAPCSPVIHPFTRCFVLARCQIFSATIEILDSNSSRSRATSVVVGPLCMLCLLAHDVVLLVVGSAHGAGGWSAHGAGGCILSFFGIYE